MGRPTWSNWTGNLRVKALADHEPTTENELVALVKTAAQAGQHIKVVGSGHSCSGIASAQDAHLVSLERYNKVIAIDKDACTITVQAGITLRAMNDVLAEHGMALSVLGAISDQSISGAISTGTHGTGVKFGDLAQQITRLTLITASGNVLTASINENPDLFNAARVGLGSLGIISTLTIACEPAFNLCLEEQPIRFSDAVDQLDGLLKADHFGYWWSPNTDYMLARSANRTHESITTSSAWKAWVNSIFLGNYVHGAALWLSSWSPDSTPALNRVFQRLNFNYSQRQIGRSDHIFNCTILIQQYVLEYALPIEQGVAVLRGLKALIEEKNLIVHSPIDVRFTAADSGWLSPAYGRASCYIGVLIYRPFGREIPYERTYREIDAFFQKLGGRPHWGKIHYCDADYLHNVYPMWESFQKLRRALDPNGMFMNDYLRRVFGE